MRSGVILAGGEGTRLGRNRPYNKSLTLVYDRPMIEYPVQTLKDMGMDYAHIVSTPQGVHDLYKTYGLEINGVRVHYETQYHPSGSAAALGHTALKGVFPVLCGDVYFDPTPQLDPDKAPTPTLFWHEFEGAQNHSVWNPETNEIIEKPARNIGRRAIVAYFFDERVYDVIDNLQPSERGEIELVDVHRWYLENGAEMREYKGFFQDMGSPDGLLKVANHIKENQ